MFLTYDQVPGFTADDAWRITDAEAMARLAAPCLSGALTDEQYDATRAVLRQALMRWKDAGSGAASQVTAGPFSQVIDTRQERRGMFWPSELEQLRDICKTGGSAKSGTASTAPTTTAIHAPWCALAFAATYCSCGADIAGFPLYEDAP